MSKHSKTPWRWDEGEGCASGEVKLVDADGATVLEACTVEGEWQYINGLEADMEHIVHCVNSHDILVTALLRSIYYHTKLMDVIIASNAPDMSEEQRREFAEVYELCSNALKAVRRKGD